MEIKDKDYQRQIIRFGNRGINQSIPPELCPLDQYVRLDDVVTNRDGTVQAAPGGTALFTAAGIHSIRRFRRHLDGTNFYIVGFSHDIQAAIAAGGFYATIESGTMSGNPLTMVPYRVQLTSAPYMYIGDSVKMIKVDANAVSTRVGIIRPLTSLGQVAVVPTSAGAGNLTGDYDWRYTYRNSVTGAESNPSDVGTTITLASEQANVPVVAAVATNGSVDQIRVWRRGGTLPDNWRLVTTLANTTATYVDNNADADIADADLLALDNDVPVTSVNAAGTTLVDLTAVPLPYLWGPVEETLFGCGDPNRPDTVYFSKKAFPESWPAENYSPMDSPHDHVINGLVYDGKSFAFTQKQLYMLIPEMLAGRNWTPLLTPCGHGIIGPFALCAGPRVWFCSNDGVYEWAGSGEATRISDGLRPLFPYRAQAGYTVPAPIGYIPVDFGSGGITPIADVRMSYHNNEVWFSYKDINGAHQTFAYSVEAQAWRAVAPNTYLFTYSDEGTPSNLLGIDTAGNVDQFGAGSRNGTAVAASLITGGHDQGFPRADKEYGDAAVWADCQGEVVTINVYANSDFSAAVLTTTITGTGLQRYVLPLAGLYARHIAYQFSWSQSDTTNAVLYWIETYYIPRPEEIKQRKTDWDDLGHPADKLVKGILLSADTRGNPVTFNVLYDNNAVGATFTIGPNTAGQIRVYNVGWQSFRGRRVRLVPTSDVEWKFYGIDRWLFDPEPESIAWHEVYWGDGGHAHDKLVKGITIEADCGGQVRTLRVFDDQGNLQQTITIGPGVAGIPAIYERSWSSFRSRNIRLVEGV